MTAEEKRERRNEINRAYHWRTRDKQLARHKAWNDAHKEDRKARYHAGRKHNIKAARSWVITNPERRKTYNKSYYEKHSSQIKQKSTCWYGNNREYANKRSKVYQDRNREYLNAQRKIRLDSDPCKKMAAAMRSMVATKLKRRNAIKSEATVKLLGCDLQWLVAWLEVQFRTGMTWENYGSVWHVDHKRPCDSFDLTDPWQQKLCFHWTNLQPLFELENLSKGNRWNEKNN